MKPNFGELSPKMIELFRDGKIAVENNDCAVFERVTNATPFNKYCYFKSDGSLWHVTPPPPITIYKATDFIIPEKFCILVNEENREEIKRIAYACGMDKDDMGTILTFNHGNQYYSFENGILIKCSIEPNDNELTFDHFKLLFDGGEEEKEIEGYICPMDLYNGNVKKGELFNIGMLGKANWYKPSRLGKDDQSFMIPKEIVETWDPIYKSKEVIIKVGACKIPVHVIPGKRIWVELNGKVTEIAIEMLTRMKGKDKWNGFEFFADNFTVTLNGETLSNVTLEEIQKVIKAYKL